MDNEREIHSASGGKYVYWTDGELVRAERTGYTMKMPMMFQLQAGTVPVETLTDMAIRLLNLCQYLEELSEGECMCVNPPRPDHEDETMRDRDDPACHAQYCPRYMAAYARGEVD